MFCLSFLFTAIILVVSAQIDYGALDAVSTEMDFSNTGMPEARFRDDNGGLCRSDEGFMCLVVVNGYDRLVYNISNPKGITGFTDYEIANFEQRVIAIHDTSIDVEVISHFEVDTRSGFPVNHNELPSDIKNQYLKPETSIQSDAPEIMAKANELVQEARLQAEAVENILAWVRAHIAYDYDAPGNDALSVLVNRRATCSGFSWLSVALLRAAGIPSRYVRGCATPLGYITGEGGGWHAWVEVYYPDVGWISMEPQLSANFIYSEVIMHGFDQCGESGTFIIDIGGELDKNIQYTINTPFGNSISGYMLSASIPAWERHTFSVYPKEYVVMLPISDPTRVITLKVKDQSCMTVQNYWHMVIDAEWLSPREINGGGDEIVTLSVDASNMALGTYETEIIVYNYNMWFGGDDAEVLRTITIKLLLVETVHNVYAPLIFR